MAKLSENLMIGLAKVIGASCDAFFKATDKIKESTGFDVVEYVAKKSEEDEKLKEESPTKYYGQMFIRKTLGGYLTDLFK